MSCSEDQNCNPCAPQLTTTESLSSEIQNLSIKLFGEFTKTIVDGRAVWGTLCSPDTDGVSCLSKSPDEGFICYLLRLMSTVGTFPGGVHDSGLAYCKNTLVASGDSLYLSIIDVPVGIAIGNTTYWELLLTAPAGPAGAQGAPGASGAGSAVNFAVQITTVTVALTNTSAVVICNPAGAMAVTIPLQSSLLAGKWFKIWTNGAANVTITPTGPDTIQGAATYVLSVANSAVEIVSDGTGDWKII